MTHHQDAHHQDNRLKVHAALVDAAVFQDWTDIQPRQIDVDMMGHVNHAVMATYFELARVNIMQPLTDRAASGFMLGDLHIRYRAEVNVTDLIRVGSTMTAVGNSSFTLGQGLFINSPPEINSPAEEPVCAATCLGTLVHVDGATRRPAPLPDDYRVVLKAYL